MKYFTEKATFQSSDTSISISTLRGQMINVAWIPPLELMVKLMLMVRLRVI